MSDSVYDLKVPCSENEVRSLTLGRVVRLHGRIVTARDRVHKYLYEGGVPAVSLADGVVFHCGPVVVPVGDSWRVVAAGPTTSIREEPYMAEIIEHHGIRVIIGKGGMGADTLAACKRYGCVYLQAVGGAAAVLANSVLRVPGVHYMDEFGAAEAMWEFDVEKFEAMVAMDACGGSIYDRVLDNSKHALAQLQ